MHINYFNTTEDFYLSYPSEVIVRPENGVTPNITFGGGISYWFNPITKIRLELLANKPFSDLLDAHENWLSRSTETGNLITHSTDAGDFYYTFMVGASFTIKDSRWKNQPKYNRKAYLKTRRYNMYQPKKRKKYKPQSRR